MHQQARIHPEIKKRARRLRANITEAEQRIWQHLRLRQFNGYKFRRQHPLGSYILDFVCLEKRLVVEVDGGQHNEQRDYDERRTNWLRGKGFKVIRFWNNEIMHDIETVKEAIWKELQKNT